MTDIDKIKKDTNKARLKDDFFAVMDSRAAAQQQAAEQQRREEVARLEEQAERLAPLNAACEDSGFKDILKALKALPNSNNGRVFVAHESQTANGALSFTIQYVYANRGRKGRMDSRSRYDRSITKKNEICIEVDAADKITCTRKDHIVESEQMKRYKEQEERSSRASLEGKHPSHNPYPEVTQAYETIKYTSLEQVIKEQLADWIASVAPDRVEELKQRMTAKPVQAAVVEAKTEAAPTPTLAIVAAIGTPPKATGRIRRALRIGREGRNI